MDHKHGLAAWVRHAPVADVPTGVGPFACAIAIPARNEADLIERCLRALAAQEDAPPFAVVLFLNNCTDTTADVVARVAAEMPFALHVYESELPKGKADAAWARRLAVNAAIGLVGRDGVVLSTDADSFADTAWVSHSLAAAAAGADIVCGFVAPDFGDGPALDFETLRIGALEFEYSQLACEVAHLIDPDPLDPWPHHLVETGANLTVRAGVLRSLGGIPHVCPGEDQAFVHLAERQDYVVRHDFKPHVTTSSRLNGRAAGGWSEDLRAIAEHRRTYCQEKLEPASTVMRRAHLRGGLRRAFGTPDFASRVQRLVPDAAEFEALRGARTFSGAWARIEGASPLLRRRRLLQTSLEKDLATLRAEIARLREAGAAEIAQDCGAEVQALGSPQAVAS